MTDELDRIRSLRDDVPAPSPDWVDGTRAELLAMAAGEQEEADGRSTAPAGVLARLRRLLARLTAEPRPVALAGAAVLTVVAVTVGVVLGTPDSEEPVGPIADETGETDETDETGQTDDTGETVDPSPSAEPTEPGGVVLASSCEGGGGTYIIQYPEGWHTNRGDVTAPCERFDEEPFELEAGTGGAPEQAITVQVVPVAFDVAADPGIAAREIARTETTVAGRDAVVVDWTSTGEGALPEGIRSYRYVVDLGGGRALVVAAHDVGEDDGDRYRTIVDVMVDSLELPDG